MKKLFLMGAVSLVFSAAAGAQSPPTLMRLATLEWPPYNGLLLPREGLTTWVSSVVAKAAGYRLLSASFDWKTTVQKGEQDPAYEGYFPEYYSEERSQHCHLSGSVGTSLVGIATLKKDPIKWSRIQDLTQYRIGVVDGYVNGDAFDAQIREKRQAVDVVSSDAVNVARLREGKVRAILVDKNVLNYTLARNGGADQIAFNPTPIATLTLHICFKRTPEGQHMRDAFDAALKTVDVNKLEADYFRTFPVNR